MTLSLEELIDVLKRLHANQASLNDLLYLQNTLYEEIGIVNHQLQSIKIAKHKHRSSSKKSGD